MFRIFRLIATSVTRPWVVSGSMRGIPPASGSPLGFPSRTSKRNTKSCLRAGSTWAARLCPASVAVVVIVMSSSRSGGCGSLLLGGICAGGGDVGCTLVVVAENELSLALEVQERRDVAIGVQMAEHLIETVAERVGRAAAAAPQPLQVPGGVAFQHDH